MARKKCTFKWQDKSLRLNGKTKVYVKMARLNCTVKWKDKSVRSKVAIVYLDGKSKCVHLNCICIFRWKDKSVRLNGKSKVNVLMARQK